MKERNTKQKEAIKHFLLNTKSHPTIYEIYNVIREYYPNIGQATVYRNVARLIETGVIRKITTKDGIDHYDGNIIDHIHFQCASCKKIDDIIDSKITDEIFNLEREYNIEVSNYELLIRGTCRRCLGNKSKEKEN